MFATHDSPEVAKTTFSTLMQLPIIDLRNAQRSVIEVIHGTSGVNSMLVKPAKYDMNSF